MQKPKFDKHNIASFEYRKSFKEYKYNNLMSEINLFFYYILYKHNQRISRKYFYRTFFKVRNESILILSPSYTFGRQYFEYRSLYFQILKKFNLKGFFIYKNLFKQSFYLNDYKVYKNLLIGYNFFIINSNFNIFNSLNSILFEKDFNKIGKVKIFYEDKNFNLNILDELNYFLNYNILMLNVLELYKINIVLYVHLITTCIK